MEALKEMAEKILAEMTRSIQDIQQQAEGVKLLYQRMLAEAVAADEAARKKAEEVDSGLPTEDSKSLQ